MLLARLKAGGHKCLIFTQMSKMLDVLEVRPSRCIIWGFFVFCFVGKCSVFTPDEPWTCWR